mmetsp:Transcript_34269/g.94644  ORF Transcript_34269/g.94644 Transcript_34269/m.94644 type:complete len:237 (+) Transcript_34269:100-810(+)
MLRVPRLDNQNDDHDKVQGDQQKDALHGPVALGVGLRLLELHIGLLALHHHLIDVVIDAVQDRALLDDQHGQFLEDCVQLVDRGGDPAYLLRSLRGVQLHALHLLHLGIAKPNLSSFDTAGVDITALLFLQLAQVVLLRLAERLRELLQLCGELPLHVLAQLAVALALVAATGTASLYLVDLLLTPADERGYPARNSLDLRVIAEHVELPPLLRLRQQLGLGADRIDLFLCFLGAL